MNQHLGAPHYLPDNQSQPLPQSGNLICFTPLRCRLGHGSLTRTIIRHLSHRSNTNETSRYTLPNQTSNMSVSWVDVDENVDSVIQGKIYNLLVSENQTADSAHEKKGFASLQYYMYLVIVIPTCTQPVFNLFYGAIHGSPSTRNVLPRRPTRRVQRQNCFFRILIVRYTF